MQSSSSPETLKDKNNQGLKVLIWYPGSFYTSYVQASSSLIPDLPLPAASNADNVDTVSAVCCLAIQIK